MNSPKKMTGHHDFLNPLYSSNTLDTFWVRRRILDALKEQLTYFHGVLLDIGCGRMPYKPLLLSQPSKVEKYIGLDLQVNLRDPRYSHFGPPDLEWDGESIPLDARSIDCAIATEVLEQCPYPDRLMKETARVLKPGGVFFFTVPFLWPIHDAPHDQYRYTPFALDRLVREAGLTLSAMQSLGGWDASLAQVIGLWIRRRPMNRYKRHILSILAAPIIKYILSKDAPAPIFTDQTMITGIAGTAIKPMM